MTQSVSHTAKPITYYVTHPAIDALASQYGNHLEKLTAQQKCLMGIAIYDHMANATERYTITESLCNADPDSVLGDRLWDYIKSIADDSDADELAGLQCALSAFVADDARNRAFD